VVCSLAGRNKYWALAFNAECSGWAPAGVSTAELAPKPRLSKELGRACRSPVEDGWTLTSVCEGGVRVCVRVCVRERICVLPDSCYHISSQMWTFEVPEQVVGTCECHLHPGAIPGRRANRTSNMILNSFRARLVTTDSRSGGSLPYSGLYDRTAVVCGSIWCMQPHTLWEGFRTLSRRISAPAARCRLQTRHPRSHSSVETHSRGLT
jgi:hypothetical protein